MDILHTVETEKRFLKRRTATVFLVKAAFCVGVPLLVLAFIDFAFPFREHLALSLFLFSIFISLIWVLRKLMDLHSKTPNDRRVALMIEDAYPQLMDSLICAVELTQKKSTGLTTLQKTLVQHVSAKLKSLDVHAKIRAQTVGAKVIITGILLGAALYIGLAFTPMTDKALAHSRDIITGKSSAISVTPGDADVALGGDLSVEVAIHRGADQATITIKENGRSLDYEMYANSTGGRVFDIFGIDNEFSYYVTTPITRTRLYHVTTYTEPAVTGCAIEFVPPRYTGLAPGVIHKLGDVSAPVGSTIRFSIETNMPVTATLESENQRILPLTSAGPNLYRGNFVLDRSMTSYFSLVDEEDHRALSDRFKLESIIDFSPVIQVITPDENVVKKKDEEISFSFKATDDYGVGVMSLTFMVGDGPARTLALYDRNSRGDDAPKEQMVAHRLPLTGLVEDGDVIAYYYTAGDNAEPEANRSSTDVRFIEIRPDKPDLEPMPMAGQGQVKKLNVSDLIFEQKHLIRSTWKLESHRHCPHFQEMTNDLGLSAADLLKETRDRLESLTGQPLREAEEAPTDLAGRLFQQAVSRSAPDPIAELGVIGDLFGKAIDNMRQVDERFRKYLPEESLPYQQSALSNLISIEIELDKHPPPAGESGEGEEQSEQQEVREQNRAKSRSEMIANLKQLSANLAKLIRQQDNVNAAINRSSAGMDDIAKQSLVRRQREIHDETEEVEDAIKSVREAAGVSLEIDKATRKMEQGLQRLDRNQSRNAHKFGVQAHQFLVRAKELLDDLAGKLGDSGLRQLADSFQKLREEQNQLMADTQTQSKAGGGDQERQTLADRQQAIHENMEKLVRSMSSMAGEMESSNPDSASGLNKAVRIGEQGQATAKMKRAENASRYGRFGKAVDYQNQASAVMSQMTAALNEAMKSMSTVSREQLAQMLQKAVENFQQLQQADMEKLSDQEKSQMYEKIDDDAQRMAEQLDDPLMDAISRSISELVSGNIGESESHSGELLALLYKSIQLLESKAMQDAINQRINLTRLTGQEPPDEYKKLVNEYFKNLSTRY